MISSTFCDSSTYRLSQNEIRPPMVQCPHNPDLKTMKILPNLLPQKFRFLQDSFGRMDFIGQFLHQLGYVVEGKRLPSDLGLFIHPFTISYRQRIIDSELTLSLLRLDTLSRQQQLQAMVDLMSPYYNINITYVY
jgi:hypothetical protein